MILKTTNLSKSYLQGSTTIHALKGASIQAEKGETIAFEGPSGSGKTTLLSLIAGLERPTSGEIFIDNTNIAKLSEAQLTRFRSNNIGVIFQQFHLMPHLTALENVSLALEILGETDPAKKASMALDQVGLSNREKHFPSQLSGGECQRVAIARASVTRPSILLADEPTGNLDQTSAQKVMDLLFDLIQEHQITFILVTHDPDLANQCGRKLQVSDGVVDESSKISR